MEICTFTLASGENIVIQKSMNVMQFSVVGDGDNATFTILGNGTVLNVAGSVITNEAIALGASQGYNAMPAMPGSPWNGITITCTAGTIKVILTTD